MGIDTGSALVVGLAAPEVCENYNEFEEKYYIEDMSHIAPYYDADFEDCLIGFKLGGTDYDYDEIDPNTIMDEISIAKKKFFELTGKEAKLYVSPNVW